ncbi:MAG: alkaline phosphatase family protein [Calditrichaeota bacterium]|nr:alkaline phosphatase family protein [Calditrichota bacterium]
MNLRQLLCMLFFTFIYAQDEKPYLILISFDGFRYDYADKTETSNFDYIAENGIKAESLIPVFPSKTFTNHYSIVTGLYSAHHGIISNNFYDRRLNEFYIAKDRTAATDPKWYNGVPIWELLERNEIKTASFFWIGSEAKINGMQPSYFYPYDHYYPGKERINQVIDWLKMEPEKRPHFITLYFAILDDAGHIYGPDANETIDAIKQADSYIGYLRKRINELPIADQVNVMIVSDHGMTQTLPEKTIKLDEQIKFRSAELVEDKPFEMIYLNDKRLEDSIYNAVKTIEHMTVYKKDQLPGDFHFDNPDRTPDLLFLADDEYSLCFKPGKLSKGNHGYSPTVKNMHAIFYAYGPAFKKGMRIASFENIHIYPLIARIFNLNYSYSIDGRIEVLQETLNPDLIQKTNDN